MAAHQPIGRPREPLKPGGVLLDIDGTLLDSNDAHAKAWVEALSDHGIERSFSDVRPLIGMGADIVMPRLVRIDERSRRGQLITKRRREIFLQRYLPHVRPFPGARELLERMRAEGLRLVAATSAGDQELGPLLEAAAVTDLLDAHTSSADAEHSKPAPDIVEQAVARAGLSSEALIMLGDTPYDILAALRAGVNAVGLRSGGWQDEELGGAVAVYEDTRDVLVHYESSPFCVGRVPSAVH